MEERTDTMRWEGEIIGKNRKYTVMRGKIKRIILTAEYRKFINLLAERFKECTDIRGLSSNVDVKIDVTIWKRRDIDGCVSAVLDALTHSGIIIDDKVIRKITIYKSLHSLYAEGKEKELDCIEVTVIGNK